MGEIILYAFFLFLLYWVITKRADFIYFIPFFGLGMDMSFNVFVGFGIPAYVRGVVFFIYFFSAHKYITTNRFFLPFYLFFFWISFLLTQSAELLYSFKAVIQVVFSMLTFIVAYNYFNTQQKLFRLLHSLFWVVVVAIVATSLGYLFGIGRSFDYLGKNDVEEDVIGLLGSSGLYGPGIVIALVPLILKTKPPKYQKILLPILSIVLYIFMLLTIRRTVIMIPIIGLFGLLFFHRHKAQIIKVFILLIAFLLVTYPLYEQVLLQRFEMRKKQGRFEEDFYKTEGRYLENVEIWEQITSFEEPARILFGLGNKIFAENISDKAIAGRMYHTDFAKLFYGVGIFGIILYVFIYLTLFLWLYRVPDEARYAEYKAAMFAIFLILVFVSINGSINIITYRSIAFLLLGALMGFVRSERLREVRGKLLYQKENT
ncbi:MAG: hypothetical protein IPM71_08815 [Bacteroidota bacterium]|nr:MAG: hypothetical protein IPM71_08815 [Bacteroidota bacterium]